MQLDPARLFSFARHVGTPFWMYDARTLRKRIAEILQMTGSGVQARFAMKACPATKILQQMRGSGIWIDAVSGNEILRARNAGYEGGMQPPQILFTSDVFRDNALPVVLEHGILPNIGSAGMIRELCEGGYRGPISIRVNPGFGHGHVNACDTGGPSSKHGVWFSELQSVSELAECSGMWVQMLHAHIGSGPRFEELHENLERLTEVFSKWLPRFPRLEAVSLGGGIPHNYRDPEAQIPLEPLRDLFARCRTRLCEAAGRAIRVEIEPGRYFVASACALVGQVKEVKRTQTNEKGAGAQFAMVDAGFVDLVRPAMYGSYHRIEMIPRDGGPRPVEPLVVAGPLCESGDVFTRDDAELLQPRNLPLPEPGDLLVLRDAGAYGYAMSSNYNSIGRAPQIWIEEDGSAELISRRETLEDLLKAEVSVALDA
ncbi:MAG: diaminopimelate decarboxylase [Verrucomicrobiota bacterium]|jgi:diaminopimelate decarboxylase